MADHIPPIPAFDHIDLRSVRNLSGLFHERVRRSSRRTAYSHYVETSDQWETTDWQGMARLLGHWQAGLACEQLEPGDRVAIMLRNCREWVLFEQAAFALGLVVVPLYTNDRADNLEFILNDAGVRVLLIEGDAQWQILGAMSARPSQLQRIVSLLPLSPPGIGDIAHAIPTEPDCVPALAALFTTADEWTVPDAGFPECSNAAPDSLASIVYTSGTTGRPKGVMLTHANLLWNAWSSMQSVPVRTDDRFLSFLPLSHTFERTVGHFIPLFAGASVAYARSIPHLAEDMIAVRPTILITVPRIFERVCKRVQEQLQTKPAFVSMLFHAAVAIGWRNFLYRQGRAGWHPQLLLHPLFQALVGSKVLARFGGRLRTAVSGGAPLPFRIARTFIGLGVNIIQGYGLTEASPVISVNKPQDNDPASIGYPVRDVKVRLGEQDELLAYGPGIMKGYWHDVQASAQSVDAKGWLHTGDQARIEQGRIYIIGRLKEIIVLANGEKIAPYDMEMAIAADPLIEQAIVIGEQRPYLSAIIVFNPQQWQLLAEHTGLDPGDSGSLTDARIIKTVLERVGEKTRQFPGYAVIHRVSLDLHPWDIEGGLITATLKLKRDRIVEHYAHVIETMYAGH